MLLFVGEDPMLTVASETRVILIDLEASTKQQFDHCCGERNILPGIEKCLFKFSFRYFTKHFIILMYIFIYFLLCI